LKTRNLSIFCIAILVLLIIAIFVLPSPSPTQFSRLELFVMRMEPRYTLLTFIVLGIIVGLVLHFALIPATVELEKRGLLGKYHELASHTVGVVGVIYAVLVAFVVVTAWQARDHAESLTLQEQHNVDDLFHLDAAYPNEETQRIRIMLKYYTMYTQGEWNQMQQEHELCLDTSASSAACIRPEGAPSRHANILAHCIREHTFALRPTTPQEQVIYQEGIGIVQKFSEARDERRLRYQERTLQPILWLSFILGGLVLVGMTYLIAEQDPKSLAVRTSALFAMIGMMVALGLVFDRPFAGQMQVSGSTWKAMLTHFNHDLLEQRIRDQGYPSECG
jgi:hypothetical protein